ncbi:unnamed protein product [Kuraishia capsulata CBS 1993]|uniref:Delta(14)-sterol reductase n=1 Tax=Kuraishia capsulata CBS 1993 TaxID=1382522 RepID=W6MNY1_9ASCO|nr:uncharacterized protein KUCA_T00004361001 [Kuraishia capsulata CBS 1993]CDK28379.1 unnamed protein product [Kuraishia capsulata CBS 1993]
MLNPKTTEKDFFGFVGAVTLTLGLPATVLFLNLCANDVYKAEGIKVDAEKLQLAFTEKILKNPMELLFNVSAWKWYLTWFFGLVALGQILPGKTLQGVELRDGTKLTYKINGLAVVGFVFVYLPSSYLSHGGSVPELVYVYDNFWPLMVTSFEFSLLLSCFVYAGSFVPLRKPNGKGTRERILATGGNSGNVLFDWFIGRELNPRIGSWDIKLFCELRPGLLLWGLLDLSCLYHQYKTTGTIYDSMAVVVALQWFYILDAVPNEEGLLTMMDITTDGFGFMLAFGDLTWVPFTYSLQARYLALTPLQLGYKFILVIVSIMALGYYIFSSANSQKSKFRAGKLPQMKSISTTRGTKLLCEGWWGLSQHINYFGDILIALSWCLPTRTETLLTYFYIIYFSSLLIHRQTRDEAKCRAKYGKAWEEYERQVPYKIIPYVY